MKSFYKITTIAALVFALSAGSLADANAKSKHKNHKKETEKTTNDNGAKETTNKENTTESSK